MAVRNPAPPDVRAALSHALRSMGTGSTPGLRVTRDLTWPTP